MTKINYKSDFDFIANLKALGADGNEVEIGFPPYDFEAVLTTDCSGYNKHYVASQKNGVTTNCFNDNGKLHIICDNHKLSIGELKLTFNAYLPNNIYPDGSQKVVADYDMNIELVVENTDVNSAEVDVLLPFFYDSAYRQAVIAGYKGTQEEYYQLASQLPNAVETATKVQASADSLASSAEQIGGAIETLALTTDAIEQGANVIKDNADTLQASATIVKTSAEQIGDNIKELQDGINAIDAVHGGLEAATIIITQGATKVESSATTLEGVSDTISGSATSLAESSTAIAEGANTIKSSADTLQENADKVSESATKVEQAVEPLVQASESLNVTKQAFEMLSSEWTDGRQAIATALTNRRYPTEPSESFHAMAQKITNMSYQEGWFAKIGYTTEDEPLFETINYSKKLMDNFTPSNNSTYFKDNTEIVFLPAINTFGVSKMDNFLMQCISLSIVPFFDTSLVTSAISMFEQSNITNLPRFDFRKLQVAKRLCYNCIALRRLNLGSMPKVKDLERAVTFCPSLLEFYLQDAIFVTTIDFIFYGCKKLEKVKTLDFSSMQIMTKSTFFECENIRYMECSNLGKSTLSTYDFSEALVWGIGEEENRQSLIDSLITYSYDRASAGMATATIKLSANTKALLTEEEIAQITAKGFTIA